MYLKQVLIVACCMGFGLTVAADVYKPVDTDDIHSYWMPEKRVQQGHLFPESAMRKHLDVCIAVAFTIEADGSTKNARVRRSEISKTDDADEATRIASAAADSVSRTHYEPAPGNQARQPIFTYVPISMSVAISGTTAAVARSHSEDVAKSCRVSDFIASANANKIIPAK